MGHAGVGWCGEGVGHVGMGWGGACRGGVGDSCRGGSCRGRVGWVRLSQGQANGGYHGG